MTGPLWTLADLVTASGGVLDESEKTGGLEGVPPAGVWGLAPMREAPITGISIDSRAIQPGDLFVALKDQRDGHEFVTTAFAAGAAAALVSQAYARQPGDGPLIRVADTLEGLRELARAARARLSPEARVIAVTGSAGKTTTKEMLRTALASMAPGRVHAADKSFNNHWGVPLTLARMPADTRFAVIEIGMNHAGEITPLTKLARPHVAIVLNVLPAHLGHFDSVEGIAHAKAEIFAGLVECGTAVVNADTNHADVLLAAARRAAAEVRTFGKMNKTDAYCDTIIRSPLQEISAKIVLRLRHGEVSSGHNTILIYCPLPVDGFHIAMNATAIVLALQAIGVDPETATRELRNMPAPAGRGERIEVALPGGGSVMLVDESYNANPGSMRAAIATVKSHMTSHSDVGRLLLVLGEMLELGSASAEYHDRLRRDIRLGDGYSGTWTTRVFTCGPHMNAMLDGLPEAMRGGKAATAAELQPMVLAALEPGDVVMVKGSNGSKVWQIANALKQMRTTPG